MDVGVPFILFSAEILIDIESTRNQWDLVVFLELNLSQRKNKKIWFALNQWKRWFEADVFFLLVDAFLFQKNGSDDNNIDNKLLSLQI